MRNIDKNVVADFGREWSHFDQSGVSEDELRAYFDRYFSLFPWGKLPKGAEGFDLGCGSGRWAYFCAQRVGRLHCIDPAAPAIEVAKNKLSGFSNCVFHNVGVDEIPLQNGSMDFGYSLGVLHHIPDTRDGILQCVKKLKKGAPFLLYLYYAFDDRPFWFKIIWRLSDIVRIGISRLPHSLKLLLCDMIALFVYYPFSRFSRLLERGGVDVSWMPLSFYRDKSFYTLRTDALDRFGTQLEHRYTKKQMRKMMVDAGLEKVEFMDKEPYHCAIGYRAS